MIRAEIDGLKALAEALDGAFRARRRPHSPAVRGRVIVTGVGKSGHVGRKIAATLASTGTPAQFVHPVEASHGDLGMIGAGDAILALSNSGETSELADIVAYSRRFEILLVAITGGARSTLAGAADVALLLPAAAEACPMGLAPTTSTTMMMTLGDALAMRCFSNAKASLRQTFSASTPAGDSGGGCSGCETSCMSGTRSQLVSAAARMSEAILVMTAKSFGCAGICDPRGRLIGVITDGDLRRHMDEAAAQQDGQEVMHRRPKAVAAAALAVDALGDHEPLRDHLSFRHGETATDRSASSTCTTACERGCVRRKGFPGSMRAMEQQVTSSQCCGGGDVVPPMRRRAVPGYGRPLQPLGGAPKGDLAGASA